MDVLVVEDEPLVREIITESLQETGLEVSEAASAEAALEALAAHGGEPPPPVLVTDVNLGPGRMDGIALAAELRHRWPALGVVVISGQEVNLARSVALAPNERHLLKPFLQAPSSRPCMNSAPRRWRPLGDGAQGRGR